MPPLRPVPFLALAAAALAAALTPTARAQPADSVLAAARQPATAFGRGLTYAEITREYELLRLRPRPDSTAVSADPFLGIQGLVVDETATPSGRTFYDAFYLVWSPPASAAQSTVELSEQPLPGNSTAILIRVDGELAFQARLPRRGDEIVDLAVQAAQFIAERLRGG